MNEEDVVDNQIKAKKIKEHELELLKELGDRELIDELERRGYDITSLDLSI